MCVWRVKTGENSKRDGKKGAEIHVHLCSPVSLPFPPSPSSASLVPNPQSSVSSRHLPRRTLCFHWPFHMVAISPKGM